MIDCPRCGLSEGRWIDSGEHGSATFICANCHRFVEPTPLATVDVEPLMDVSGQVPYAADRPEFYELNKLPSRGILRIHRLGPRALH